MSMRTTIASCCILSVSMLAGACGGGREAAAPGALRIAVVPKGSTHEHWKRVHAGAEKAAAEYRKAGVPVDVLWKAPIREDDREQQVQVVEGFISQRVNGLVLAPLDSHALLRPVEEAAQCRRADRDLRLGARRSREGRELRFHRQRKGGRLAAQRMGEVLKGTGTVLMLRYQEGSAATEERERGFLEELKTTYPGVTVISSDQYAGATRDTAKRTSENLLNRYGDKVNGIFTPNESSTAGMLLALQDIQQGRCDQLRRLRLQRSVRRAAPQGRAEGVRRAEPGEHGVSERQDDGRSSEGQARAQNGRHRRAHGDRRQSR